MNKHFDAVAIGEYLIDFSPNGIGRMGNPVYEMNPGGAPVNCLASCTKLGGSTAVISAVGNDFFGKFLKSKALEAGIDVSGLQTADVSTTLVFVSLDENGEREFAFVREPGADTGIDKNKIDTSLLDSSSCLHFGSLSLTDEPARSATKAAVEYARSHGIKVSYDPNYRASLWQSETEAKEQLLWGLTQAELVKMSEEEFELLTGFSLDNIEKGINAIFSLGVKELYITAGSSGAYYALPGQTGFVEGFKVGAVDTTGCGDAFTGAILYLNTHKPDMNILEKTRFANAVGALCATKPGGICAMPGYEEVSALLEK